MNITEKILARASGRQQVVPDDVIFANVDKVMVHDVSGPGVIKVFDKLKKQGINVDKLWDPTKVWVAEDHFVPSADIVSAENIVKLSNFTKNLVLKNTSSMEWGNMEFVTHYHTKKHWCYLEKYMLEVILILIPLVHWGHLLVD